MHRWQMDGLQDCPQLALCHFAYFATLPADADGQSRTKVRAVQLQLSYWLANRKCPQTIMGIVRVKLSILTWHHYILTQQELI